MAFLITTNDLKTHIYNDIVDEITREDADITQRAIDTALDEAAGYMSRYDIDQLLGTAEADPTIVDNNLKSKILDLVKWHLVQLGSPNIEYGGAKDTYVMTLETYFQRLQAGKIMPRNWPYLDTTTLPDPPQGIEVTWQSNKRRRQHW